MSLEIVHSIEPKRKLSLPSLRLQYPKKVGPASILIIQTLGTEIQPTRLRVRDWACLPLIYQLKEIKMRSRRHLKILNRQFKFYAIIKQFLSGQVMHGSVMTLLTSMPKSNIKKTLAEKRSKELDKRHVLQ